MVVAHLLPLSLGFADGILNALTISTNAVLHGPSGLGFGLAARVASVAFITAVFTVFVAEYAQLRADLARAEVQLNLTTSGRLATSRLGKIVTTEAATAAAIASAASLLGAFTPLAVGASVRTHAWLALPMAIAALALLGAVIARVVGGRTFRWATTMAISGVLVSIIGDQLHIA